MSAFGVLAYQKEKERTQSKHRRHNTLTEHSTALILSAQAVGKASKTQERKGAKFYRLMLLDDPLTQWDAFRNRWELIDERAIEECTETSAPQGAGEAPIREGTSASVRESEMQRAYVDWDLV